MRRVFLEICAGALCASLAALAPGCIGCWRNRPAEPPGQAAPQETLRPARGENLFEQGETRYFPVVFLHEEIIEVHDTWQPDAAAEDGESQEDLAYSIGDKRFDGVVKLIAYLNGQDTASLEHGVLIVQAGTEKRPGWEDDMTQLCTFAEFENINLFLRVPGDTATAEEHVYWLVKASRAD